MNSYVINNYIFKLKKIIQYSRLCIILPFKTIKI